MKIVCLVLLLVATAQSAEVKCPVGDRLIDEKDGTVYYDNIVEAVCSDPDAYCTFFTYIQSNEMGSARVEYGACMSKNATFNCTDISNYSTLRNYGNVSECLEAPYELTVNPPEGCDARNEDDLFILPSCTMREALQKMADCSESYYRSFPYENKTTCGHEVDGLFKCYADMVRTCSAGRCPTVLDSMPGARQHFNQMRDWSYGVEGLDSAIENLVFSMMLNDSAGWKDTILDLMCPTPGVVPDIVLKMPSIMDPTNFTALLGDFGMSASDFEMFSSLIPCSESYYTTIAKAHADAVIAFYTSKVHDDLCSAFNNFFNTATTSFINLCDFTGFSTMMLKGIIPVEYEPAVELMTKAFTIWGDFFFNYRLPGCRKVVDYTTTCVTGERMWYNGVMYSDNTVETPCSSSLESCFYYNYDIVRGDEKVKVEGGGCTLDAVGINCDSFNNFTQAEGFGEVVRCNVSICNGSFCNDFKATPPVGCSASTTDIQIFPGCTLTEFTTKYYECYQKFYQVYPYSSTQECYTNVSLLTQCLSELTLKCLDGRCPTVLDNIPGVRATYPLVRQLAYNLTSPVHLMERMKNLRIINEETANVTLGYTYQGLCPDFDSIPGMIESWLGSMDLSMFAQWFASMGINIVDVQKVFPCEMDYFKSVMEAYQMMFQSFVGGKTFCDVSETYFKRVITAYENHCDPSKYPDFLYTVMPEYLHGFVPSIIQACEYMTQAIMANPRLPGCGSSGGNNGGNIGDKHHDFNCEVFYKSNSKCGMKKAWLCDYAKWKYELLSLWLPQFLEQQMMSGNGMSVDMPPCYTKEDYGEMCRHKGKKVCAEYNGCSLCYCTDHEYKDLSGLTTYWRDDYRMWRNFYNAYSQSSSSNGDDTCEV